MSKTQLIKGYSTEDIQSKIEWEGVEYFLLDYLDIDLIECKDFKKEVQTLRLAFQEAIDTLGNKGIKI